MPPPDILYDSRWIGPHGIGRVAAEYGARLKASFRVVDIGATGSPSSPLDPLVTRAAFARSGARLFFSPGFNGNPAIGERQIFFLHDLTHVEFDNRRARLKRLFYDRVIRRAARKARAVITVSEAARSQIVARWPECAGRIHVVPNGLSPAFTAGDAGRARSGVVLFANNRWHKNLDRMLAALADLRSAAPAAFAALGPVTLVGTPDDTVRAMIARYGLGGDIREAGRLDDAGLAALYCGAKVLLFCSLSEGFGLPVIEALGCGAAVICSDIPVFREVGGPGCTFVDPMSTAAIAEGLRRVAEGAAGPTLAEARAVAARFTWDRSFDVLRTITANALAVR